MYLLTWASEECLVDVLLLHNNRIGTTFHQPHPDQVKLEPEECPEKIFSILINSNIVSWTESYRK
jgi:hypothetical protein